jgi:hypothetical protein
MFVFKFKNLKDFDTMKRIITVLLACFFLVAIQGFSQSKQSSLIIKKTADWCPFCGTYGWTFFSKVKDQSKDLPSIMIAMHYSGGLGNATAIELNNNFSGPGQPVFFDNGRDMVVGSSNVDARVKQYIDSVNVRAAKVPRVNINLKLVPKGNQLAAQIELENTQTLVNVEYSLSLYVLRDNLIANQASVGPNASHTNILSASLTASTFGIPAYKGNIFANTKLNLSQDFTAPTLHNGKPDDVKIAAILWSKNASGKYDFVNGTVVPISNISTSFENLASLTAFKTYQRDHQLIVESDLLERNSVIKLFNLKGELISEKVTDGGERETSIEVSNFSLGVHLIQLTTNGTTATQKVLIHK